MDLKVHVDKLTGASSWKRWKRQVGVVLKHHKVLAIVQQVWKLPEPLPKNADAAAIRAHEEQVTAFEDGDTKAMMILVNSLDDFHVNLTDGLDTAVAVWTKLTSVYEQSSSQRLDRTLEQFFTSRMSEGEDLVQYISRLHMIFREVNEELTKHEANELPDLVLMSRVVSTLPKEFFEFKNVWDNIPIKDRSVDLLTERVRLIETRLDSATPSSSGEVLHATRVTQNADRKKSQKKLKCFILQISVLRILRRKVRVSLRILMVMEVANKQILVFYVM